MKILFIHNNYFKISGEERAIENIIALLEKNGHTIKTYFRGSAELGTNFYGKILALKSSIINKKSIKEILRLINEFSPDIVQIQNLYPLISPPVLKQIKKLGVPVVMRSPNYRLFCPNGLFMRPNGQICEKCTGPLKELACVINNCESDMLKSSAYALRNFITRKTNAIIPYIDTFIVQSEFQKNKFIEYGISENKISILPGLLTNFKIDVTPLEKKNVLYVGRLSNEKGIFDFIETAKNLPHIPFAIAGGKANELKIKTIPKNIKWFGYLNENELNQLHSQTKIIVIPSRCYEGFPNVAIRAMAFGIPVIASNIGVLTEIVNDKKNGLLFNPGSIDDLTSKIEYLYSNLTLCESYGNEGNRLYNEKYSESIFYEKIINIYKKLLK